MNFMYSNYTDVIDTLIDSGKHTINYEESLGIKLSENFSLSEFLYSDVAIRKGISNEMPLEYIAKLQYLVTNILQPLRDKFGRLHITSGYRSVELCLAIGSNSNSNHTKGTTADIEPLEPGVTNYDLFKYIADNMSYHELIAEFFPNGWVHVSSGDGINNMVTKLKDNEHNYAIVGVDYISKIYSVA